MQINLSNNQIYNPAQYDPAATTLSITNSLPGNKNAKIVNSKMQITVNCGKPLLPPSHNQPSDCAIRNVIKNVLRSLLNFIKSILGNHSSCHQPQPPCIGQPGQPVQPGLPVEPGLPIAPGKPEQGHPCVPRPPHKPGNGDACLPTPPNKPGNGDICVPGQPGNGHPCRPKPPEHHHPHSPATTIPVLNRTPPSGIFAMADNIKHK